MTAARSAIRPVADRVLPAVRGLDRREPPALLDAPRVGAHIQHLLHLWMPAARVEEELVELWERLERRPGLSRQWQTAVNRIRDEVAVTAVTLLDAGTGTSR